MVAQSYEQKGKILYDVRLDWYRNNIFCANITMSFHATYFRTMDTEYCINYDKCGLHCNLFIYCIFLPSVLVVRYKMD